jgi:glyoxylase-like metal-dependent hydrolase (beta-lactamase superfamily II)
MDNEGTAPVNIEPFFDPATSTFSYLVDDGHGSAALIDPVMGFDPRAGRLDPRPAEAVEAALHARSLRLQWVLETHAHADHVSAAPRFRARWGARIAIGAGITGVQRVFRDVFNAADMATDGAPFDRLFADGERFAIGRLQAEVLHVPGHTPADVAYRVLDPDGIADAVFAGDTLFMPERGTARCDFPGGSAAALYRSARRLLALPAATRIFVCHDYPEGKVAPRCEATVDEHRRANVHVREGIAEEAFVALRTARDATLALPALMLPAIQVNVRAGELPPAEANGVRYLKIPLARF